MSSMFVILSSQRTGSNMLASALDSHPDIRCHGEIFRKKNVKMKGALRFLRDIDPAFESAEYRDEHFGDYIAAVRGTEDRHYEHFGFKLMFNQAPCAMSNILNDPGFKKVLLYRDNLLAVYSSGLIAKETGQGNAKRDHEIVTAQVRFQPGQFDKFCDNHKAKYEQMRKRLGKFGESRCMEISYIDACTVAGVCRVAEFIGADPARYKGQVETKKRNTSSVVQRFSNPDVVEKHLARMRHLDWMEEGMPY